MDVRIGNVRLAFPLDLALHNMLAIEKGDTLLDANSLRLDIRLLPLLKGQIEIDGLSLYGVKVNTRDYISDTNIKGYVGEFSATAHGIDLNKELVCVNEAKLNKSDLYVTLSDTAAKDTTTSTSKWNIEVKKADICNSKVYLQTPGDSMRITAKVGLARMRDGHFDTGNNYYAVRSLQLRSSDIKYDVPQAKPSIGLDPNHIAISEFGMLLDTLTYNKDGVLKAGLRTLSFKEKCGLNVTRLSGNVYMDSAMLRIPSLSLRTPSSSIDADIKFDFNSLNENKGGYSKVILNAKISNEDIVNLARGYVEDTYLKALPHVSSIIQTTVYGNVDNLTINKLEMLMPGIVKFYADGYAQSLLKDYRKGKFDFNLRTQNLSVVRALLPASLKQTVNVPDGIFSKGNIKFSANDYNANLTVACDKGSIQARAHANLDNETYDAVLLSKHFPIRKFLRGMNIGNYSGTLRAGGKSFNPLSSFATFNANAKVDELSYDGIDLSGIAFDANLLGGKAKANFVSTNPSAQVNGKLDATIGKQGYEAVLNANIPSISLHKWGITKDTLDFGTDITLKAAADKHFKSILLNGSVCHNHFTTPKMSAMAKDVFFDFNTTPDTTIAYVSAGDMCLRMASKEDISRLSTCFSHFLNEAMTQASRYELDQEKLKTLLPVMSLYFTAGRDNPLYNIARMKGCSFSSVFLNLNTNPNIGISGDARVGTLNVGSLLLDTIHTHILQDSTGVQMFGAVENGKKNPNPLNVRLKSYLLKSGAGIELSYLDMDGDVGVNLGLEAEVVDSGIHVHLYPHHPVLAYRNFTVNKDNYIFLGKDKSIRADVDLVADDGTGMKIYGEPKDSLNDLTMSINQVNLGELSTVLPYLPQLSGFLSGDVHINADYDFNELSAMASFEAKDFKYEDTPLGNIGMEAIYLPKTGGEHHASAFISSNGTEVLACNGTYFDQDGGTFEGEAQLYDFPLQMLNSFLSGTDIALKGIAKGELNVKGTFDAPVINGSLDLDSTHIYSDVYGFDFLTDERAIDIDNSWLVFENYNLYSTGKNPLVLNGTLDMSDFSKVAMNFTMRAEDFELINTRKKAKSMIYGKVYTNYNGTLNGTLDNLTVRGKLEVLDKTDVTYILKDSPLSVDDRLHDLVQFTNFSDTTANKEEEVAVAQTSFDLSLGISISDAAQFHCNLSEDGQSYVNLEGGGDLTMRITQQGDMRMTGRFTVNSGKMKYQLPVIPLKTFDIEQGSYAEFTGDIMNPTLSLVAKERTKAVVTEDEKQRSVTFDVGVAISQTLNNMGLDFTIEAPEDLTVQNQLASMSNEQRTKAAVTMMATGMFMTDETLMSGTGFKATNALNAFLQSEIQNIASSALKTIDINLGVENGTAETGTSTTDYSFQFAKRFWGNRISVVIGGKVSTGADAQNSAESFINNISVEYRLDEGASRYVKVFYDRDTQDPLEGQLTKTGAGLVLKKKTDRLGELFIFRKKKQK